MRRLLYPLISLFIILVSACNPSTNPALGNATGALNNVPTAAPIITSPDQPLTQTQLIQHIQQSTVALVVSSKETGDIYRPYCAGVWVGPATILTAAHCIEDSDNLSKDLIGVQIHYISYQDVRGQEQEPAAVHLAAVMKHDHKHDLILLVAVGSAGTMPAHQIAKLTHTNIPPMGSTLHTMGQTIGLYWSYSRGYVAGYRLVLPSDYNSEAGPYVQASMPIWHGNSGGGLFNSDYNSEAGPYVQASMPIWHGNSGGGLFNDAGELVAICHTVSTEAPMISFNIAPISIRHFLGIK